MFERGWAGLALVGLLLGLLLQQPGLTLLATLILTVTPLAWLWNRYSLQRVEYTRFFGEKRAFPGEVVELTVRVTNRKPLPLAWLRIEDQFPLKVSLLEGELVSSSKPQVGYLINLLSMRWYEEVAWRYRLRCDNRGLHYFGPVRLTSGDIFGFYESRQEVPTTDRLIVYPHIIPLAKLGLPSKEPFGDVKAEQRIFEDPSRTIGVRDYRPRDAFKRIHWKATARHRRLQVKVYEPTTTPHLVVMLNVATFARHWEGVDAPLLERAVTVAASIAHYALEHRYATGFLANSSWPLSDQAIKVMPGRAPHQITHILEALAAVTPFPLMPIEGFLARESRHLFWGATLVCVTPIVTEPLLDELERLHDAGRRLCLISLDDRIERDLKGITVHCLKEKAIAAAEEERYEPAPHSLA
ncbi:MAG TPA: DUF58 domain-containing protein [Chloroflexi bacterium]|nr:DUF58 domain-containing protein [Chloroflexota bacterium]